MILINVLLFVTIAAGMLMLMLSAEDIGLERAVRMRGADQALAIAYGGEASAIVALRRDAQTAPDIDSPVEAWGAVAENGTAIEGGRFELSISDAQARFNLNNLMTGEAEPVEILDRIISSLGLKPELAVMVTEYVRLNGPVADLGPLRLAGLGPDVEDRLAALVTVLPRPSPVNVNSANEPLLAILLNDPLAARMLIERRTRAGMLTPADLPTRAGLSDAVLSVTSQYYWVRTRVTINDTRQQLVSLIGREAREGQPPSVRVVRRWRGVNAPPDVMRQNRTAIASRKPL